MSISVPPKGDEAKRVGAYFTPLKVDAQAVPDMTVRIQAGSFYTALGEHKEFSGGNTPTISAPTAAGAKWVVVAINENALIEIYNGATSSSPELPVLPENVLPLAGIFVGDTATMITSDMVFDLRPLWQIRPENIPNLAGELADRPTITDVNALLALKADIGGTPETSFVLNQDQVGVPGADVELIVERGANPNTGIRWNETSEQWEFTNDGVTYDPIGASSGVYYTQAQLDGGQLDTRYYTKVQLDGGVLDTLYYQTTDVDALVAGKADAVHTHVAADITDFVAEVNANAPVKTVAGKTGHITLVEADISDLDKYDQVSGAVTGNIVTFGASSDLADSGFAPGDFALLAHTHVAADVTDFNTEVDGRIAVASIDDLSDVQAAVAPADGHILAFASGSGWYTNRFLNVGELGDVVETAPTLADALMYNGAAWVNRALVKSDVSDFVEADYVHVTGNETIDGEKTFNDDMVVNGSLTVAGTDTELLTDQLRIQDKFFDVNWGETGAGVGGGTPQDAGMRVKRGTEPDALMYWDESSDQWIAGVVGNANPVITGAHSHMWIEVIDFGPGVTVQLGLNNLNAIQDVDYPTAPALAEYLRYDGANWVNAVPVVADISDFAAGVTAELNANTIDELQNVTVTGTPAANEYLAADGTGGWANKAIVKSDVTDFVESDYVHTTGVETIAGDKTFSNNVNVGGDIIITGDLTVNGTNNVINTSTLTIEDNIIEVNKGETGAGVGGGAGNSGMQVDRGTLTDAVLVWDELNTQWEAGVLGSTVGISLFGHLHVLTDVTDVTATAAEVNQLNGIALGPTNTVQLQLNDKISRIGDSMDPGANLVFSATGEVLGLPATPSATGAASKEYVDAQVAMYDTLAELNDTTIAAPVNGHALMHDGVDWKNRVLVEADLSDLGTTIVLDSDIGSTVQAYDAHLDALSGLTPSANREAMMFDGANWQTRLIVEADISDLGTTIVLDTDIGSTVQAWDADLDTIAGLAHTGDEMIYSNAGVWATTATTAFGRGLLNEATAITTRATLDLYSATELDGGQLDTRYYTETELDGAAGSAGAKIDKVAGSVNNNVTLMDATGGVQDSGTAFSAVALTANHYTKAENDGVPGGAGAKVDKVAGVVGNLVEFAASGAIADSGVLTANILTTASVLNDLNDVTDASSSGDLLQQTGAGWQNIAPNSIPQFVHTQGSLAEAITGDKTFSDNVIVNGDLTVNGTTTTVNSVNLDVSDAVIRVNDGYAGVPVGSIGMEANRDGTVAVANLLWDELGSIGSNTIPQRWVGGVSGAEQAFAQETVTVSQPDYEVQVAGVTQSIFTTSLTVPVPTGTKAAEQVFVNGIKQIPGATKHYQVTGYAPLAIAFNAGQEPPTSADVEFYAFGTIG